MADLVIDAAAVDGDPGVVDVTIELTDADGNRVSGRTDDEVVVRGFRGRTNSEGELTVSLVPNADIAPANTYYTVRVRGRGFLIEKGSGTENLVDCEVVSPADLGLAATLGDLADVDVSGVDDGDSLVYDEDSETWVPGAGGGGAPTDATYVTTSANGSLSNEQVLGTAVVMTGTLAARPAAGTAGRLYLVSSGASAGTLYRDGGSAWVGVARVQVEDGFASFTASSTTAVVDATGITEQARITANAATGDLTVLASGAATLNGDAFLVAGDAVTSVGATAPVTSTGGTTPTIGISATAFLQRVDGGAGVATALGTVDGSNALDLSAANAWTLTADGNVELTFSNPPDSGSDSWWVVWFTQDGSGGHTLTVPAALDVTGTLNTTAGALTLLVFGTADGGTTYRGALVQGFA